MVISEVWAAGKQTSVYNMASLQYLSGDNNKQAHIIHFYVRGGLYIILFDAHSKNMRAYWEHVWPWATNADIKHKHATQNSFLKIFIKFNIISYCSDGT